MADSAISEAPPPSRLLELPAELRNRIYRLVLVRLKGDEIQITSTGYDRGGGLLQTCQQIQKEAHKIFYYENSFHHTVRRFDIKPLSNWTDTLGQLHVDRSKTKMASDIAMEPCWSNLREWRSWLHEHGWPSDPTYDYFFRKQSLRTQWFIIGGMFHAVYTLHEQPWELAEEVILGMRKGLIEEDRRWAEE